VSNKVTGLLEYLRYALREFQPNSGFAIVTVFTVALVIGAKNAIFSVVHVVLLALVPYCGQIA
jgi:hypothetical protein